MTVRGTHTLFLPASPLSPIPELRSPQIAQSRLPAPGPPGGVDSAGPGPLRLVASHLPGGRPTPGGATLLVNLGWEEIGKSQGDSLEGNLSEGTEVILYHLGRALHCTLQRTLRCRAWEGPPLEHSPEEMRHNGPLKLCNTVAPKGAFISEGQMGPKRQKPLTE